MAVPRSAHLSEYDVPSVAEPVIDSWDWILRAAIVAGLIITLSSIAGDMFRPLLHRVDRGGWMTLLQHPSMLWMTMGILLLSFRTLLWFRYRPFATATPHEAPALTVVIPAYNEGPMVAQTIDSVAAAIYPRERLKILVIDDGSRDDTWWHIQQAAARHPHLVTALQFAENRGKRAALAAGFHRAHGDIVITIDSDCIIERGTLLAMTGPFRSPRVGAVAGKVLVHNRYEGFIPRLLHVRFLLSFDFLRAAESAYGTVYCTPGALSAYRLSVVREVLDRWLNQTFLGVRATYGEDRALTNFILERGFDSVYQRTGVVRTVVPNTYGKLCKMFLRWDRSYIREDLHFLRILWKRPWKARLISLVDRIITNLHYPVAYVALGMLFRLSFGHPVIILHMLLAIGLASLFYTLYYLRSERSLDFLYGVLYAYFSLFALSWIFPYAALTLRARAWMTR
jgi:hyaluronan synthase